MGRSNAEATIYTERDGDAFAPGTSLAREHPDAAITPRPPSRRRRSRLRSATASRRSSLRRLGTESLHDSSLEETVRSELVSEMGCRMRQKLTRIPASLWMITEA